MPTTRWNAGCFYCSIAIIEEPLHTARAFCDDQSWVRFVRMRIPTEWPDGRFDLIVLSEVLYSRRHRTSQPSQRVLAALDPDGVGCRLTGAAATMTHAGVMKRRLSF
jgi:hypothetical protein